ncbi:tubulin monoglycylase TTLL3 isoform X1 [Tachysurus ichikawai]
MGSRCHGNSRQPSANHGADMGVDADLEVRRSLCRKPEEEPGMNNSGKISPVLFALNDIWCGVARCRHVVSHSPVPH